MDFFDSWNFVYALSGRRARALVARLLALALMTPAGQRLFIDAATRKTEAIGREVSALPVLNRPAKFALLCAATLASTTPE